jgi:hypothetical protein
VQQEASTWGSWFSSASSGLLLQAVDRTKDNLLFADANSLKYLDGTLPGDYGKDGTGRLHRADVLLAFDAHWNFACLPNIRQASTLWACWTQ